MSLSQKDNQFPRLSSGFWVTGFLLIQLNLSQQSYRNSYNCRYDSNYPKTSLRSLKPLGFNISATGEHPVPPTPLWILGDFANSLCILFSTLTKQWLLPQLQKSLQSPKIALLLCSGASPYLQNDDE